MPLCQCDLQQNHMLPQLVNLMAEPADQLFKTIGTNDSTIPTCPRGKLSPSTSAGQPHAAPTGQSLTIPAGLSPASPSGQSPATFTWLSPSAPAGQSQTASAGQSQTAQAGLSPSAPTSSSHQTASERQSQDSCNGPVRASPKAVYTLEPHQAVLFFHADSALPLDIGQKMLKGVEKSCRVLCKLHHGIQVS